MNERIMKIFIEIWSFDESWKSGTGFCLQIVHAWLKVLKNPLLYLLFFFVILIHMKQYITFYIQD